VIRSGRALGYASAARCSARIARAQVASEAMSSDALDLAAVREAFAEQRDLRPRDLESLGMLQAQGGHRVPSVGGLLLFGRERLVRFPDAHLQLACFAGRTRGELIDRARLDAYPPFAIPQALAFVARNTRLGMRLEAERRRDLPALPPLALREALVNAIVHADDAQTGAPIRVSVFDDRVEIENPGVVPARDNPPRAAAHPIGWAAQ
jgi:ATP-dependent DNA helicase RecG